MIYSLENHTREQLEKLLVESCEVKVVDDPHKEGECHYIVISIDPCKPMIREVKNNGDKNAFSTLVEAKSAARTTITNAMDVAHKSLAELRQIGIEPIEFVKL